MLTKRKLNLANIVPVAGQRIATKLQNGTQTHRLLITISGNVNITVAGAAVRNRGSLAALIEEFAILDNGREIGTLDARVLRVLTEHAALGSLASTRLATAAIQNVALKEQLIWHFAHPFSINPRETALLERNPQGELQLVAKMVSDATALDRIVSGGTKALTNFTITVTQIHDQAEAALPYYTPTFETYVEDIAQANAQFRSYLRGGDPIRTIVLQEDSTIGEVSDIISTVSLVADGGKEYVSPISKYDLQREAEALYGPHGSDGYTVMHFQDGGRLSELLQAGTDLNLRLVLGVTPTVTAGAAGSKVRVTVCRLSRDDYVDPRTARRTHSEALPAQLL